MAQSYGISDRFRWDGPVPGSASSRTLYCRVCHTVCHTDYGTDEVSSPDNASCTLYHTVYRTLDHTEYDTDDNFMNDRGCWCTVYRMDNDLDFGS